MKEVAKRSNVSIATVSCVINNTGNVKKETKEKVLSIIKELNYTPNFAGRMLKIKETKIIGAYVTDLQGYFYGEVLNGLKKYLRSQGYEFVVISGSKDYKLITQNIFDGIVVLDSNFMTGELIKYANSNLKIILMDRIIDHENITCLTLDNEKGTFLCMEYLVKLGYDNVVCLTGPSESYDSQARISASLTYAKNNNLSLEMAQGNFDEKSGYEFAQTYYKKFINKRAVFTFNDEMLVGIYNFFKEINEDLECYMEVASFDNIDLIKYLNINLATVNYSKSHWGYRAGELLLKKIKEKKLLLNELVDVNLVSY